MPSTSTVHSAHLVGVGGSGMRALAAVLLDRGWRVSGSDLRPAVADQLVARGVTIVRGHAPANVPTETTVLVHSGAVDQLNPEIRRAQQLGIPIRSYAEMVGEITRDGQVLAVAGTHGKSTVTAMAAEILVRAGLDPTVICGSAPAGFASKSTVRDCPDCAIGKTGGRHGGSRIALIEACEYRENFLHLRPNVAVLLNVEHDHFDYYRTAEQLTSAFVRFLQLIPTNELVIASQDCPATRAIAAASTRRRVVTFGLSPEAHWQATNLEHSRGCYRFDLVRHGRRLTGVVLAVPGRHNVLNALAAAALARHCGVSIQHISHGLAAFRGLSRRLEVRGRWCDVPWIDDYAHHPTEVKASLTAVRQMFPRRRLCCVFQPHQASRLTILLDELAAVLHNADRIAVAEVFRAREGALRPGEATAADLAARLHEFGDDVLDAHQGAEIARRLAAELQPGDVLLTMGAGDLGKNFDEFHKRLRRNRTFA